MTDKPAAANNARPPSFDAAVMAYLPSLRKTALALAPDNKEDLVHDTIAWALDKWQNFRGDWGAKNSGFHSWLNLNMRAIHQGKRRTRAGRAKHVNVDKILLSTPPAQQDYAELSEVLRTLSGMDSDTQEAVIACANGDGLGEIAKRHGVTASTVSMRAQRARADLAAGRPRQRKPYPRDV